MVEAAATPAASLDAPALDMEALSGGPPARVNVCRRGARRGLQQPGGVKQNRRATGWRASSWVSRAVIVVSG